MNVSGSKEATRTLVWDIPTRVFHWLLAVSFVGAYLTSEGERLAALHAIFGYTAGALVVFRIVWGLVGTEHARFTRFPLRPSAVLRYLRSLATLRPQHFVGHNPAGSWAVVAMLALLTVTALTGWMAYADRGPDWLGDLHEGFANATVALIVVHIGAVLLSSLVHRENLVAAMISGYKRGRGAAAAGARGIIGAAVVAVVLAFWGGYLPAPGLELKQSLIQAYSAGAAARHHSAKRDVDN